MNAPRTPAGEVPPGRAAGVAATGAGSLAPVPGLTLPAFIQYEAAAVAAMLTALAAGWPDGAGLEVGAASKGGWLDTLILALVSLGETLTSQEGAPEFADILPAELESSDPDRRANLAAGLILRDRAHLSRYNTVILQRVAVILAEQIWRWCAEQDRTVEGSRYADYFRGLAGLRQLDRVNPLSDSDQS